MQFKLVIKLGIYFRSRFTVADSPWYCSFLFCNQICLFEAEMRIFLMLCYKESWWDYFEFILSNSVWKRRNALEAGSSAACCYKERWVTTFQTNTGSYSKCLVSVQAKNLTVVAHQYGRYFDSNAEASTREGKAMTFDNAVSVVSLMCTLSSQHCQLSSV